MNRITLLDALFKRAADGLLVTDRKGIIQLANPAFWALFGLSPEDCMGISLDQLLDHARLVHQLLANGGERELTGRKKDGSLFPVRLTLAEVVDHDEIYYAGSVHDLSREKNSANLLAREQQLGQLKSRLVSMASHEFRSPLSQIQLSASLVERYYQRLDQDKILSHLRKIRIAVNDMTDTLNDFLSLERIEAGTFQPEIRPFDLFNFVAEVCAQMQLVAAGHELVHQHSGKERVIYSDRNLLKHCAVNLVSNAVKYSVEPGRIVLRTEVDTAGFTISVSDRGIGIPAGEQQKLFEPFFRASNASDVTGTGLGLHIVKNYVHQLGGEISVKSREHKGTTFSLSFPLLLSETAAPVYPVA